MRKTLLAADCGDDLRLWVELRAILRFVFLGDFPSQPRDAVAHAVAMIAGIARGLGKLGNDRLGCGISWVSHPQINDVNSSNAFFIFQLVDPREKIGRQAADPAGNVDAKRWLCSAHADAN